MKIYVVGKRKSQWVDGDTGEMKQSAKLFYYGPAPIDTSASKYDGLITDALSIPFDQYDDCPVDCEYNVEFSREGKLIGFNVV